MRFFTLARNPSQLGIPSQLEKKFQNQKKSREQLQNPNRLGISRAATRNSKMEKSQFFKISLEIQNEIMTPKSEFGSRVKFFFWKFSLEMIEFILIRNPNEILRVKLSKLGFHFQNFIPYKKRPYKKRPQLFLEKLHLQDPNKSKSKSSFTTKLHYRNKF